jgi:hypothetical protein
MLCHPFKKTGLFPTSTVFTKPSPEDGRRINYDVYLLTLIRTL